MIVADAKTANDGKEIHLTLSKDLTYTALSDTETVYIGTVHECSRY
jgi:hypothetical protein